jgi:hypothetical protein
MPIDGTIPRLDEIDEAGKISFEKIVKLYGILSRRKISKGNRSIMSFWGVVPTVVSKISGYLPVT